MDIAARERGIPEGDLRLTWRRGLAVGGGLVICSAAVIVALWLSPRSIPANRPAAWTPLPHRVRVEVLNASKVLGAARIGRLLLQHAGLDVVQSGNADSALRGSGPNRILVRLGDTVGVGRIIEVLGGADIVLQADPSRVVDLTVVLGRNFMPPPDRFSASQ